MPIHILIQRILKFYVKLKPEVFFWNRWIKKLEKRYGTLILYRITAADYCMHKNGKIQHYLQLEMIGKDDGWDETAKLIYLVREKTNIYIYCWKPLWTFCRKQEKNEHDFDY